MKGIILAGGSGTRLYPLTKVMSKQLLPIYDKPMICYPLATLMQMHIKEILIISTPDDLPIIEKFLGNGHQLGLEITYEVQDAPKGISEAFIIGEKFIGNDSVCLILGDNIFHFVTTPSKICPADGFTGAHIVGYHVSDPERFGIMEISDDKKVISVTEKPKNPKSNYAVVGLYFYDNTVSSRAKDLSHSERGELEITDLNKSYLQDNRLNCSILPRGSLWMDAGTIESLNLISNYVRNVAHIQNLKISCVEEIAYRYGLIPKSQFEKLIEEYKEGAPYRDYLEKIKVEAF